MGALWPWVRALVSIGILAYLGWTLEWARFGSLVAGADLGLLGLAPVLLLIAFGFAAVRWRRLLLGVRTRASVLACYRFYLVGAFYNLVLPGAIGGDAVRAALMARATTAPLTRVAVVVLLERATGVLTLFVIGALAVAYLPPAVAERLGPGTVKAIGLLGAGVAVSVLAVRPIATWVLAKLVPRLGRATLFGFAAASLEMALALPARAWVWVFTLGALFQGLDVVSTYLVARAIGIDLPPAVFFVIVPVVYVVTMLPISLGGLGVREGALVVLLGMLGTPASDAISLSLLIYAVRTVVGVVGGTAHLLLGEGRAPDKEAALKAP
jgi:hypothetical protein